MSPVCIYLHQSSSESKAFGKCIRCSISTRSKTKLKAKLRRIILCRMEWNVFYLGLWNCVSRAHIQLAISFLFFLIVFTSLCNLALSSALEWNAWAIPSSGERPVSFRSWAAEPTRKGTDTPRPHLWWNCYSLTLGRMVHVRPFGRMLSWQQASGISDAWPMTLYCLRSVGRKTECSSVYLQRHSQDIIK